MVDFNDGATTSTPASDLVKKLILEARYNSFQALETYNKQVSLNVNSNQAVLKSRLGTWFMEHQAYIKRHCKNEKDKQDIKQVEQDLFFNNQTLDKTRLIEIIKFLNETIDNLKIIRIDNMPDLTGSTIEQRNKAYNYK